MLGAMRVSVLEVGEREGPEFFNGVHRWRLYLV